MVQHFLSHSSAQSRAFVTTYETYAAAYMTAYAFVSASLATRDVHTQTCFFDVAKTQK